MISKQVNLKGNLADKLSQLHDPPSRLFYRGSLDEDIWSRPTVAIVGARKATAYGREATRRLSEELAREGVLIVSGLALGIDSIAHEGALNAGGLTVAVLPSGIDKIYPATHQHLGERIVNSGGLLISEYSGTAVPAKYNFIARNRIIAALADVILIPEAAEKSGSLHTAGFGLDLGRTICAVPGSIYSNTSQGTNSLIKNGAVMTTDVKDVLEQMGITKSSRIDSPKIGSNKGEQAIIDALTGGPQSGGWLQTQTGLDTREFLQSMTMLEISGVVKSLGNDKWILT